MKLSSIVLLSVMLVLQVQGSICSLRLCTQSLVEVSIDESHTEGACSACDHSAPLSRTLPLGGGCSGDCQVCDIETAVHEILMPLDSGSRIELPTLRSIAFSGQLYPQSRELSRFKVQDVSRAPPGFRSTVDFGVWRL